MLLDAVLGGMVVSWLRGGRWHNLTAFTFRRLEWIGGAFLLQTAVFYAGERALIDVARWGPALYVASFAMLLFGAWPNRQLPGLPWLVLGIALNALVITANGGQMPVSVQAAEQAGLGHLVAHLDDPIYFTHAVLVEGTRLSWLADVIPIPAPYPRPRVVSIGDLLMALGAVVFLYRGSGAGRRPPERPEPAGRTAEG